MLLILIPPIATLALSVVSVALLDLPVLPAIVGSYAASLCLAIALATLANRDVSRGNAYEETRRAPVREPGGLHPTDGRS